MTTPEPSVPLGPVHAFADDALGDGDATEVAARIRSGEISGVEACEAALRRAEAVQPVLAPVAYVDPAAALAAARRHVAGPFGGVPTYVKDNLDVAGMPTNQGTDAFVARPARRNSPFVAQLEALGLVVLGKSRMPELGLNASTEYARAAPVRNPWQPSYSAGASSGGAAALVAAGVVPLAHGNDGGGSIRIPAAACGLVGLKPSRGRLAPDPIDTRLPVPIVAEGVLTRSVRDTAHFLAGAEETWRNPALPPVRAVEGPGRTRLRVGVVLDSVNDVPTDPETRAAVLATAELLADLGHHVEDTALPVSRRFVDDFSLYWGLLGLSACSTGRYAFGRDFDVDRTDNLTRGLARMARARLARVPGAVYRLRRTSRDYRRVFSRLDVLLSPVTCFTTPPIGCLSPTLPFEDLFPRLQAYAGFTPLHNAAGAPAVSLPLGRTEQGLPIGCQLCADVGDDRTLLEVAYELEQARPWPRAGG
ncbi:MAG TPA: amidase [Nocardioidaceae bacterium]